MSGKERDRMTVMVGVTEKQLTLVQAAALMGVGCRQSKRVWKRYQADGDAGLVHRLRGKPSARRKPPDLRVQALALYAEERYADFGPTLMAEQLDKAGLAVDHETLRRWRLDAARESEADEAGENERGESGEDPVKQPSKAGYKPALRRQSENCRCAAAPS